MEVFFTNSDQFVDWRKTKEQATIYKALWIKQQIETNPIENRRELGCSGRVGSSCCTSEIQCIEDVIEI